MENERGLPVHKVLLLGGTSEAVDLAGRLAEDHRFSTITSLAGRTRNPATVSGEIRQGGFGGVDGLAAYIIAEKVDAVVDATHPFAAQISRHAAGACERLGTSLVRLSRPPWQQHPEDNWVDVPSVTEAAVSLPLAPRAFVTTGRQELEPFLQREDLWSLIRVIDPLEQLLDPARGLVITGRGPFAAKSEIALMETHRVDWLVSKNSGGSASYAKIEAARALGIPVMMVSRPPSKALYGEEFPNSPAVVKWLGGRFT